MASRTSSSQRSSSYSSSSRYSTSSSYRSEGSLNGSSDSADSIFEPFFDSAICSSPFGEEGPVGPNYLHHFTRHSRSSYEHPSKTTTTALVCESTAAGTHQVFLTLYVVVVVFIFLLCHTFYRCPAHTGSQDVIKHTHTGRQTYTF